MLLTDEERKKFATLVNTIIDIPLVPEEMEQPIFEHALGIIDRALEDALPTIFHNLMREAESGIDKDHVTEFVERLIETVNKNVDLPYFNEEQEAQLLRIVITPLVKAMTEGKVLDDLLGRLQPANAT